MMPDKEQIQRALDYFRIVGKLISFHVLSNMQEERKGQKAIRLVIEVCLENNRRLIVRFLNERAFIMDISRLCISTETLERQSEFSEILRNNGMLVPKKYSREGKYCMPMFLDGLHVDVTVEEYLGEPLKKFSPELFGVYGELLGQMHQISLDHKIHIGFSIVFNEVSENQTDYKKLFSGTRIELLQNETLEEVISLHNAKKEKIRQIWPTLPKAAVQGDIYSCNNVALLPGGIGFYDFNIAADEVLLGDFLHLWFRTIYDIQNENSVKNWNLDTCWEEYTAGYQKYRRLTAKEKENFALVYSLLGSIYVSRYTAELLRRDRVADAEKCFDSVLEMLQSDKGRNV